MNQQSYIEVSSEQGWYSSKVCGNRHGLRRLILGTKMIIYKSPVTDKICDLNMGPFFGWGGGGSPWLYFSSERLEQWTRWFLYGREVKSSPKITVPEKSPFFLLMFMLCLHTKVQNNIEPRFIFLQREVLNSSINSIRNAVSSGNPFIAVSLQYPKGEVFPCSFLPALN